ncbi:UNVERIFIED_CONTAM: hypothetical protein H355_016390 [Colinus virginianus]|nr:hypothetical protein H355_016390 [Colinus virginianus]
MEERPPSHPRVAWAESGAPQERTSPREPYEVTEVQPLHADAGCLPLVVEVEKEAVHCIEAYIRRTEDEQERAENKMLMMTFLESICAICKIRKKRVSSESVASFCREKKLAEKVKELLENEYVDQLCAEVRYQAMLAIIALSEVKAVSEEEIIPFLNACFKAIFHLPPEEDLNVGLYNNTLHAMDNMLHMLLASHHTSRCAELRNILEALLCFTRTQSRTVRARAMRWIWKLSSFMASSRWQEPFGKFLQPSQRTDIVLMTLKSIGDCGTQDKDGDNFMLDVVLTDPGTWLMDVPEILWFVQRNLGSNSASLQQILFLVLDVLTSQFPREVLISVLTDLPQRDSTTLDIWKRMFDRSEISEEILNELRNILLDRELCGVFNVSTEVFSLLCLTVMPPTEEVLEKLRKPEVLRRFLKIRSLPILWLVLRGLVLLSQRPETAREIQALLPDVTETLQFTNKHTVLMALNILKNMVTHLRKREASPFAPELSEKLLPLFNHQADGGQAGNVCLRRMAEGQPCLLLGLLPRELCFALVSSEVRECSILLFKDLIESVTYCQKAAVKKNVHGGLLPLHFRMSDETPSIAQASGEALVACARFLKWKELKHQAKRKKKVDIKDCLLEQGRRRVDEYLWQSVPYLKDSQASLRCEAVEFIGLALQQLGKQSEEKVKGICTDDPSVSHAPPGLEKQWVGLARSGANAALEPLKNDADPSVRSAATGIIQRYQRQKAEPLSLVQQRNYPDQKVLSTCTIENLPPNNNTSISVPTYESTVWVDMYKTSTDLTEYASFATSVP